MIFKELLSSGGNASGPVPFMPGADGSTDAEAADLVDARAGRAATQEVLALQCDQMGSDRTHRLESPLRTGLGSDGGTICESGHVGPSRWSPCWTTVVAFKRLSQTHVRGESVDRLT